MKIWRLCSESKPTINEDLVITIDGNSLTLEKATDACGAIAEAAQKNLKLAVCFNGQADESAELKLVFMSMISHNDFSIIEVDDLSDVDEEYAESVLEYTVEIDELKAILGPGLGNFAEQLMTDSTNPINELVRSLINITVESTNTTDTTNGQVNVELEEKMRSMEASMQDLRKQSTDATTKANNYKQCVDEQALIIKKQNAELEELNTKLKQHETRAVGAGNNASSALTYVELNLDRLKTNLTAQHARIDVEHVLYFKELTPCMYINSFIVNFIQYVKINKKKNIICLVYDDSEFNKHKYGRLKRLNAKNFVAGQSLKDETIAVVTDAAPQILEDALITHDMVIVYDRIGSMTDIIVGRNVHKFAVVNSQKEMLELKRTTQLTSEQFITTFGTDKDTLSVRQIREYKQMSNGGKIMSYANMACTKNNTESIYERLLFTAGINLNQNMPSL